MNSDGQPPAPPVMTSVSVDVSEAMEVLQFQAPALPPQIVDVPESVTAFYKEQSVIEFMIAILDIRDIDEQQELLTDSQVVKFSEEIIGCKIEVTHLGTIKRKYRVINVTKNSAETQVFPMRLENDQTVECTVANYFLDKHNIKLRYPHLPCLQAGEEYKHTYLPLEVCKITKGQRCLKKFTDIQAMSKIISIITLPPPKLQHVPSIVFYQVKPVIEFMCEVLDIRDIREQQTLLSDSQRDKFKKEIIGLEIEVTHSGPIRRKYIVCNVTKNSVQMQFFSMQLKYGLDVECTVAKYFLDKYKMSLRYPHLPCLQVGERHRYTYLPLEVCNIVTGPQRFKKLTDMQTSTMVKVTAPSAPYCEREVNSLVQGADLNNDSYIQESDPIISPTVSSSIMELHGLVSPPSKLQCDGQTLPNQKVLNIQQSNQQALPDQKIWNLRGKRFLNGVKVRNWAIACFAPQNAVCEDALRNFITQLQEISSYAGMPIVGQPCFCKYAMELDQVEPMFCYLKLKFTGLQLIVVILEGKTPVYDEVKKVGDTVLGIVTQCIKAKNVVNIKLQTLFNICTKMNVKLSAINEHSHSKHLL